MGTDSLLLEAVSSAIIDPLRAYHSGRSTQSTATTEGKRDTQLQGVMRWVVGTPDMHLGPLFKDSLAI